MVILAQRNIGNEKREFVNAPDYLETWDDSDIITAVNAQKIGDMLQKWWHNHSIIIKARFRDQRSTHGGGKN